MNLWQEFKSFAFKGNLIELALAVVLGGAFGNVVNSLAKNVLMPLASYILPGTDNYRGWHLGRVELGAFLGELLNFLVIAGAMYLVGRVFASGARLYEGACAVCHAVGGAPLFGSRPSLALNSNLHSAAPDNLIQVILHGIAAPVSSDLGYMPGFKDSMTSDQVAELVSYLRQQFAPDKAPWTDVRGAVERLRQAASN